MKDSSIDAITCKLEARLNVKQRIVEHLKTLKPADLDSPGRSYGDLLEFIEMAKGAKNYTALAQLQRLRLDVQGLLKSSAGDRTAYSSISDESLLEKLAGTNLELRKELQKILGRDTFEKADPAPAPTSTTKH